MHGPRRILNIILNIIYIIQHPVSCLIFIKATSMYHSLVSSCSLRHSHSHSHFHFSDIVHSPHLLSPPLPPSGSPGISHLALSLWLPPSRDLHHPTISTADATTARHLAFTFILTSRSCYYVHLPPLASPSPSGEGLTMQYAMEHGKPRSPSLSLRCPDIRAVLITVS
jgi:hypothetical protein